MLLLSIQDINHFYMIPDGVETVLDHLGLENMLVVHTDFHEGVDVLAWVIHLKVYYLEEAQLDLFYFCKRLEDNPGFQGTGGVELEWLVIPEPSVRGAQDLFY